MIFFLLHQNFICVILKYWIFENCFFELKNPVCSMFDPLGVHERVVHLVARAPPQPSASGSGGASTSARTSGQHPRHHIHHQHHHHHPPGAQHLLLRPIVTNDMGFFGMSPTSLYE